MPIILLKTTGGLDLETSKGKLSLKGFGLLNNVSNEIWQEAKKNNAVQDMLDKGFLIESSKETQNVTSDTLQDVQKKQDKQKNNKVIKEWTAF